MSERSGEGPLATTKLFAHAWGHERFSVRCTYISGPTVEILNVMGFPADPINAPILATDFINFGGKPRIAVADLQPVWAKGAAAALEQDYSADSPEPSHPASQRLANDLSPLAEEYQSLRTREALPDWCADYFTPFCFYSLPGEAEMMPRLEAAYFSFLQLWLESWVGPNAPTNSRVPTDRTDPAFDRLRSYKEHHVTSSPGLPYMARVFGAEWSDEYLRSFMYA